MNLHQIKKLQSSACGYQTLINTILSLHRACLETLPDMLGGADSALHETLEKAEI